MDQNQTSVKNLYRSRTNRVLFGVCGGLGEYFGIDPIIFRIIFIALSFGGGFGVLLYIILAFIIPIQPLGPSTASSGIYPGKIDFEKRTEELVSEFRSQGVSSGRNWIGGLIVFFGVFLLLNQIFPIRLFSWGAFWALIIIAMGLFILLKRGRNIDPPDGKKDQSDPSEQTQSGQPQSRQMPDKETHRHYHYHHHGGGVGRLFFGLLFLVIGFAYLAQNLGIVSNVNVNLGYLLRFWPVLIIIVGLSMLSRGTFIGRLLSVIIVLGIIALIILSLFVPVPTSRTEQYNFDFAKDTSASSAVIDIKAGASTINIKDGASGLASGRLESNISRLVSSTTTAGEVQRVDLSTEVGNVKGLYGLFRNDLQLSLSDNVPISLKISAGASTIDFDASSIQLQNLQIDSGASKLGLIFGDRVLSAVATINAGASSIDISLPSSLGVRLNVKSDLSSKDFPQFTQLNENTYESTNYSSSLNKIDININAGVSKISINWL